MLDQQEPVEQNEERFLRFTISDRVEHWMQVITFVVLAFTGLVQKWPQAGFSEFSINLLGGIETTRIIHRIFATILLLAVVYHLYTAGVKIFVKRARRTMVPGPGDLKAAWHGLQFNLGMRKDRPPQGYFTWEEKIEYWAIVWGTLVMTATGFMLWNPIATAKYLPGQFIPAAKAAHGGEALLAVLAILVWHFYHVHVKSFNTSIFTGYLDKHHMEEEHPLELAELQNGNIPEPADPVAQTRSHAVVLAGLRRRGGNLAGRHLPLRDHRGHGHHHHRTSRRCPVFVPAPSPTVPLLTTTTTEPVDDTTTTTEAGQTTNHHHCGRRVGQLGHRCWPSCSPIRAPPAIPGAAGWVGLTSAPMPRPWPAATAGLGSSPKTQTNSVVYTLQLAGGHAGQFTDDQLAPSWTGSRPVLLNPAIRQAEEPMELAGTGSGPPS